MDTKQVAELIGTTPRVLRRWLRSDGSTFQAVGSNARYDFTDRDLPTIRTRFTAWQASNGAVPTPPRATPVLAPPVDASTFEKDRLVWAEEGDIVLEDIRDPRVREDVRRIARQQEDRLDLMLLAVGLHITQAA